MRGKRVYGGHLVGTDTPFLVNLTINFAALFLLTMCWKHVYPLDGFYVKFV